MSEPGFNSLSTRSILAVAGLALLGVTLLIAVGYFQARSLVVEQATTEGAALAAALQAALEEPLAGDYGYEGLVKRVAASGNIRNVYVMRPDGEVLAPASTDRSSRTYAAHIPLVVRDARTITSLDLDRETLSFVAPVMDPASPATPGLLVAFERNIGDSMAGVRRGAGILAAGAAVVSGALAVVLHALLRNGVIRPAALLCGQAELLGQGNFSARSGLTAATAGSGEMLRLANAFDTMADRLEDLEARRLSAEEKLRASNVDLEARVRQRTSDLEVAVRELESFSYAVAHNLRTPLRSIDGFCRILAERLERHLDDESTALLLRVRQRTQGMGTLIDDLLTLAQVARADIERIRVDLSVTAADCISALRRAEPEREVDVVIQPGMEASADADLVRIALSQLLDNAWNFTRNVDRPRIEVGIEHRLNQAVAYVRDNGAGFDVAYVERLFTPFKRLHPPGELSGSGIGLAIVQRIVKRHGGQVWAQSAPGAGATFFFTLAGT